MHKFLVLAFIGLTAVAQTQIDLATQAKRVDFSKASSTKPLQTGTPLPSTCAVGQMFFKTDAPAGANLYACTAANVWSVQGGLAASNCWADASSQILKCQDPSGNVYTVVQTASSGTANQWVDYIGANGTPHTSQPTAAAVGAVADPGSNGVPYRSAAGTATAANADQLSGPFFCQDAGTSGAYSCSLTPAIIGYTTGTTYWFRANTANTGSATLNLNGLGPKTVVKQTNQALAANDIRAGQWVMATYDGTNLQMQSQPGNYTFSQIGGTASAAQLPATAMQTNQGNTVTAGTQDFSQAAHTLPMKSGSMSAMPSACSVGETYFATDAAAGSNMYGCTATNVWSLQAGGGGGGGGGSGSSTVTIQANGTTIGSRSEINLTTGGGIIEGLADTGTRINIALGLDTSVAQTLANAQSGAAMTLTETSANSTTYAFTTSPILSAYPSGPGQLPLWTWKVGTTCSGGSITGNVDTLGSVPIVNADSSNPTVSQCAAGQKLVLTYDSVAGMFFIVGGEAASAGTGTGTMVYPAAGVPSSTGSAWGSSYTAGTAANNLVQLNSSAQLPAVSAALLTNFPALNQNTSGNAATATALTSAPTTCPAGQGATGINATGIAQGCTAYVQLAGDLGNSVASPQVTKIQGTSVSAPTGTGAVVLATAPTLTNPVVGTQGADDGSTKAASTAYVDRMKARAIGFSFDGGGSALTTSNVGYVTVPFSCTLSGWNATADTGTITWGIWKVATGTAIPTSGNSIVASAAPAISSGTALHSTTLTGWTTAVGANDIFGFSVTSVSGTTRASIVLECDQ